MTPYYDEDRITIYHGDCRDVLPSLSVDAVITDPPYGVGKSYGDNYDDSDGPDYWAWFLSALETMRAAAPTVVFTHRVTALRHVHDWDWIYVWHKPRASSGLNHYPVMPHWEPVFAYGIGGRTDLPRRFDVLSHNPIRGMNGHPAPKPLSLFTDLIRCFAPAGTVVDPFMGTGTTLRAAKDLGRKAIGIEIEEKYCEIAVQRLAQGVLEFS
jgi:DNA modification methylase